MAGGEGLTEEEEEESGRRRRLLLLLLLPPPPPLSLLPRLCAGQESKRISWSLSLSLSLPSLFWRTVSGSSAKDGGHGSDGDSGLLLGTPPSSSSSRLISFVLFLLLAALLLSAFSLLPSPLPPTHAFRALTLLWWHLPPPPSPPMHWVFFFPSPLPRFPLPSAPRQGKGGRHHARKQ